MHNRRPGAAVPATPIDRLIIERCLKHDRGAWNDFVDRFLGLFYHVIHHTAYLRSVTLPPEDVEDLAAEVLVQIVANNYNVLRQFQGRSSLATYLTVIARRICVHELAKRAAAPGIQSAGAGQLLAERETRTTVAAGLDNVEEVQQLL